MDLGKPKPRIVGSKINQIYQDKTIAGKLPPQAIELEEAVLGALLLEREALTTVIEILRPESFYKDSHQLIYKSVIQLYDKSEPVDLLTVTNQLRENGELEIVGGAYYVTQLTTKVNSAVNVEFHARIVAEQSIKRDLIQIATEIHTQAYDETTDVFDLLNLAESRLYGVSEANIRKNYEDMRSLMAQALKELQAKKDHDATLTGVPSGFTSLDRVTAGWQKSDLVILAARPGMGKTAFVLSTARNAAVDHNQGVAIFSLEMSRIQLVNRLISSEAELGSEKIKKGNLEEHEWAQLHHKIAKITSAPIFIDDTPALSIRELRTKCRRLKAKNDIKMIIIDYLQLMSGDGNAKGSMGNREQEIASISRALKNLAKELDVPVIALSQLSRQVENRPDKRPQLSDLRESGSIEQDADMVIFLYRPEYYKIDVDEAGNSLKGVGEVIIAKHRNGSLDTVQLRFIGNFTKFGNLEDMYDGDDNGGNKGYDPNNFGQAPKTFSSKINDLPKLGATDEEEPF